MKNTIEKIFQELVKDHREIPIGAAVKRVIHTLGVLDQKSESMNNAKKAMPKTYVGMLNSITLSLITSIATYGMSEEEVIKFAESIEDPGVKRVGIAILKEADGE